LTQPLGAQAYEPADSNTDGNMLDSYISARVVRWLEHGGARAAPLSYRYTYKTLTSLLKQANGVVISADSSTVLDNPKYMDTVSYIIEFASINN
jgi:hypothetical protein